MMRAVSASAKCRPVTGSAAQQDHIACCRALGAQHKGPAHGAHHAVHKGILPENGLFSPRRQGPQSCQDALRSHRQCPLASRPSASISRSIWRLSSRADCTAVILRFQLGILLFEQGIQLLLVFQQGSVQVRHCGGPFGLLAASPSGWAVPPKRGLPPAPNTPFIRFSQSSVYAMVCPPFLSFSSSIVYPDRFCNSLLQKKTAGVYTYI